MGCRNGGCGRAVVSAEEDAQGCVLACKTCPQGDIKVKALGRVWNAATAYKGARPLDNTDLNYAWRKKMARVYVERALARVCNVSVPGP